MRESCTWSNNNLSIGRVLMLNETQTMALYGGAVALRECVFVCQRGGEAKRCVTSLIWCRRSVHLDWLIVCESSEWTWHSSPTLLSFDAETKQMAEDSRTHPLSHPKESAISSDCLLDCFVDFNSIFVLGAKCLINRWNGIRYSVQFTHLVNITKKTYAYINIYFPFYRWYRK